MELPCAAWQVRRLAPVWHTSAQERAGTPATSEESSTMKRVKSIGGWLLLAFLVYAVVKSPAQAADIVRTSFDIIAQGFRAIFSFFDTLLGRK